MDECYPRPVPATSSAEAENWTLLEGLEIEIHLNGHLIDRGVVDMVTFDGSILWLKQDGATGRRLIERTASMYLRINGSCPVST